MISRSLLLVLACIQLFTTAQFVVGPDQCCFRFQTQPINARVITDYNVTDPECLNPGVIFTLQDGRHVCADPKNKWVKDQIIRIGQRLINSLNNTKAVDGPDQCCFRFQIRPIPIRVITDYKETDILCTKPGVIFTLQDGRLVCADPKDLWVMNHMYTIEQHLFYSLRNTEVVVGPDQCCFSFQIRPIPIRVITYYKETDILCTNPGVIFTLQNGRPLCADPQDTWVKNHMNRIDQLLLINLNNTEDALGHFRCCVRFQTQPIPVGVTTEYRETELQCLKPGIIFIQNDGRRVCADPKVEWVKNNINKIELQFYLLKMKNEEIIKPVLPASDKIEQPDKPVLITSDNIEQPVTTEQVSTSSASQDLGMDTSAAKSHPTQQDDSEELESGKTDSPVTLTMVKMEEFCIASHTGGK
ncbi:uncharacterized protein LOC132849129 [Tachysurus vachellii]|uniref:uncharacterized protein LOC132849129 n=1 Tax=Tachysurus vachellii TaxID=175792 RepID=UPI00296AA687|nr:uncharacterized protein LOC132849129 [Tachysurus vachellii]